MVKQFNKIAMLNKNDLLCNAGRSFDKTISINLSFNPTYIFVTLKIYVDDRNYFFVNFNNIDYEQGIKTLGTGSFITEYLIISTLTGTKSNVRIKATECRYRKIELTRIIAME